MELNTYTYLIGVLILFFQVALIYVFRKDLRQRIVIMFSVFFWTGPFLQEFSYNVDWWAPQTILDTSLSIENILLGSSYACLSSIIYFIVSKNKDSKLTLNNRILKNALVRLVCLLLIHLSVVGIFRVLGFNTFLADIISFSFSSIFILYNRFDLLNRMVIGGVVINIFIWPIFWIWALINPGWIEETWMLENLSGWIILAQPFEDLVWHSVVGLWGAGVYEYVFGVKGK